jgi:hypothetical protein
VRILLVSYNAHVITSPHHDVSEIAHNLFQTLINMCDSLFVCRNATLEQMSVTNIYQANNFSDLKFITLTFVHLSNA